MSAQEQNEHLFSVLTGRTLKDYHIDYKEGVLTMFFDSGVEFTVHVDDDAELSLSVQRQPRH